MRTAQCAHDVDQSLEALSCRGHHSGRYGTIRDVSDQERPQVSFIAFLFSLASNAAVHFGDLPDPMTNETRPPDLEAAAQLIEIIAMLEEKTRGNLTVEERQLIDQVLYELRMRFVEASRAPGA